MFDIRDIDNLASRRYDVFKTNWTRPAGFTSKQWYLYKEIDEAKKLFLGFPREFSRSMKAALFPLSLDPDQLHYRSIDTRNALVRRKHTRAFDEPLGILCD